MLWDKRIWDGEISSLGSHCITYKFTGKTQELIWHLSGVCAPNDGVEKEDVWWELARDKGLFEGPWVV